MIFRKKSIAIWGVGIGRKWAEVGGSGRKRRVNSLEIDGGSVFQPRDFRSRIAVGGALQRHRSVFQGDNNTARSAQKSGRFRPDPPFQLGKDTELGFRTDPVLVRVRYVTSIISLNRILHKKKTKQTETNE